MACAPIPRCRLYRRSTLVQEEAPVIQYREVPGFPCYRVGTDGSVWSCWTVGKNPRPGQQWRRLRTPHLKSGYQQITLCHDCVRHKWSVNRLILFAFVGPAPPGKECRHLDGNKDNNCLENLLWGTRAENIRDAIRHGTFPRGERSGHAKISDEAVTKIRQRVAAGEPN